MFRFSSVLLLLPLYEAFSIPIKSEKFDNGHKSSFHEQYIEWEKIRAPFRKKTFDALNDFFWNFNGKSELVKVKKVHPNVTVFCEVFCDF